VISISRKIKEYCFNKQRKKHNRKKSIVNYYDAVSIGILYDASKEVDYIYITQLVKELQKDQKKVKTIGFIRQKKMPAYGFPKLTFEFCNKKDFSWNFKPKHQVIKEFMEYPFDIIIDLSPTDVFQIKYVAGLSKASLIVGPYDEKWNKFYDILIKVKPGCSIEEFVQHCYHYLKMLKK
jgi:hypothetical protein